MSRQPTIQVFEHQQLAIGEKGFEKKHFDTLVRYNESHGDRFLTVQHRKIKFNSYVGVLQVGNLSIEILPKADKVENFARWHGALLTMLHRCRYIRLHSLTEANLTLRSAALIDLFFDAFLSEVELLLRLGLVKGYRLEERNQTKLKGRIQFHRHMARNLVHKERFYTLHQHYDRDIVHNQILRKALLILSDIVSNATFRMRAKKLLLEFEEVSDLTVTDNTFTRLKFSRKTEPYRQALNLARLIILRYNPDLKSGREHLLAILFDMNKLFEEYVFRILKKEEDQWTERELSVYAQQSFAFFQERSIRPDIIMEYKTGPGKSKVIVDTKWKEMTVAKPSIEDLHHMHTYNVQLDVTKSVLLYPKINLESGKPEKFAPAIGMAKDHYCQLCFAELFDPEGRSIPAAASGIINDVLSVDININRI